MKLLHFALAITAAIALTQSTHAQYGNGIRGGTGYFMPQYYSAQSVVLGGVHPLIGPYSFRYDNFYYNVRPTWYPPAYNYGTPYGPSTVYGSAGGLGGDPILAKQMDALKRAQRVAAGIDDTLTRKTVFDIWANEKGAVKAEELLKSKPVELRNSLTNPSSGDVLKGISSNVVLVGLKEFSGKAPRVAPAFLPPEVIDAINFVGGPAADALMLIRAGQLTFPAPLQSAEFEKLRSAIAKDFASLAQGLNSGKRYEAASMDQITVNTRKLRKDLTTLKDGEHKVSEAYLDRIETAMKTIKEPSHAGLVVSEWSTVGVSVVDLVKHMNKHKMNFGSGQPEDDIAYSALHRGLTAYYLSFLGTK